MWRERARSRYSTNTFTRNTRNVRRALTDNRISRPAPATWSTSTLNFNRHRRISRPARETRMCITPSSRAHDSRSRADDLQWKFRRVLHIIALHAPPTYSLTWRMVRAERAVIWRLYQMSEKAARTATLTRRLGRILRRSAFTVRRAVRYQREKKKE